MPNTTTNITETQVPAAPDENNEPGRKGGDTSPPPEKAKASLLTKQESQSRLQQAARIFATGAIRAAQKAAADRNMSKPKPKSPSPGSDVLALSA